MGKWENLLCTTSGEVVCIIYQSEEKPKGAPQSALILVGLSLAGPLLPRTIGQLRHTGEGMEAATGHAAVSPLLLWV